MKSLSGKLSEDWTILRYGWLVVFIIHICYLIAGNQWLKSALALNGPLLESMPEVRITYALTSARMIIVGFSSVLLMITVFIYEIFKMVKAMKIEIGQLNQILVDKNIISLNESEVEGDSLLSKSGNLESDDELADEPDLF